LSQTRAARGGNTHVRPARGYISKFHAKVELVSTKNTYVDPSAVDTILDDAELGNPSVAELVELTLLTGV